MKETLTHNKLKDLFGQNAAFVEVFDYDTESLLHNQTISIKDAKIYKNFKNLLKNDARFNNYYELVAVVSLSVCSCSDIPHFGKIIRSPRYVKPSVKFLGQTHYAGTIICRDKKSSKILPVPNKWFYTGFSTCVMPGKYMSLGLPGLANLIDGEAFCQDYDTYEKLIRIQVLERQR